MTDRAPSIRAKLFRAPPAVAVLLLSLAGCTPAPDGPSGLSGPQPVPQSPQRAPPEAASATPVPESAAPMPPVRQAVAVPYSDPDKLVGRTAGEISSMLGEPSFVRRDPPAEFWRFRHEGCVLELFFYPKDGAPTVDHYEAHPDTGANAGEGLSAGQCLGILIRDHDRKRG